MFAGQAGLLSSAGVERGLARGLCALKAMNLAQMVVSVALVVRVSARPGLHVGFAAVVAASGLVLSVTALRAGRLVPWAVTLDALVVIGTLWAAPLFQAARATAWSDWPVAVSFLLGPMACITLSRRHAVLVLLGLAGGPMSWMVWTDDAVVRRMALTSWVPYLGFALGGALFARCMRELAQLADGRAEQIRVLEEERTRRVLHTPYRLVHDLATILGERVALSDTTGVGELPGHAGRRGDATERARLAEALASLREIEAVVRGTEPACANLAADLDRLREQFADLPLILDTAGVTDDLAPAVVLRIREAVRSLLQNVRCHADAGEVVVQAIVDTHGWLVTVHDDGCGFDPDAVRLGVGLGDAVTAAIGEVGGTVEISSAPGEGTLVLLAGPASRTPPSAAIAFPGRSNT